MPLKQLTRGQQRSLAISRELGQLIVATSNDSFAELEPKFMALQKRLVATVSSETERLEIRRRIAEELVNAAFGLDCPWPIFGRTLRRIQRLGYTDVERRYHIAALFLLWCQQHPEHAPKARRLLDEAEQRLLRLPRQHLYRTELLEQLLGLRARTGLR
ncbi:MAG: hypothetical protein ACJ8AT_25435 [Hyalangium sp.]|uniref:hypothetical protein n=1 Tax=Hyalangium sp. TaxID=2028555 RepID=UPI00389AED72